MSAIETIRAAETRVPLERLYLSPMNPRQSVSQDDVIELAESIWTAGLIQSLAGLADADGRCEIVAGGRRLRALQYLADLHPDMATARPELASPVVMLAPDADTARTWATVENIARRDLDPADEIRAYAAMAEAGSPPAMIARAFAVTEKHVYRRLALSHLPEPVLDALAAKEISLSMAACFTVCNDAALALDVLDRCRGKSWSDYNLKQALTPAAVSSADRRAVFVGADAYRDAGGPIVTDLFADEAYFGDAALLDRLFAERLEAAAAHLAAGGWKWATARTELTNYSYYYRDQDKAEQLSRIPGELTEAQAERYDELAELAEAEALDDAGNAELDALNDVPEGGFSAAQKAVSGVVIYVDAGGNLRVAEGIVRHEDKAEARSKGLIAGAERADDADTPKSPISNALADDLRRAFTGARQHAALRDPELLLALLAYELTGKMGYGHAFGIRTEDVPNLPTTGTEGYALDARLTTPDRVPGDAWTLDHAKAFRAFRKKGPDHVKAELTRHLAALLIVGNAKLGALIDKEVSANPREVWTPVAANFWNRVPGSYRCTVWRELLDLPEDHPSATSFAKMKKAEQADRLEKLFTDAEFRAAHGVTEAQADRIGQWLPEIAN